MPPAWRMTACWLASLPLVALLLAWAMQPVERPSFDFANAEIAVIGSSLSMLAFPASGDEETSLLQDGRRHIRVGLINASPEEIEDLLAQAIDQHVGLILLELRPFLFTQDNQVERKLCDDLLCKVHQQIILMRYNFRDRNRQIMGRPSNYAVRLGQSTKNPLELDNAFAINEPLELIYPVSFLRAEPSAELQSLNHRAREDGIQVVLYLPPRSPVATAYIGPGQSAEIERRARHYADALQLPIFAPDLPWSNDDFIDRAHMSRSGREKFIAALRQWWDTAP